MANYAAADLDIFQTTAIDYADDSKLYREKRLSTPAGVVILVIPDILLRLICDILIFICYTHLLDIVDLFEVFDQSTKQVECY